MSPCRTISPPGRRSISLALSIASIVAVAAVLAVGAPAGASSTSTVGATPAKAPRTGVADRLGFELKRARIAPRRLFDGPEPIRLRYSFAAARRTDLRIRVVEVSSGNTVAAWRERRARPGRPLIRRWNGINRRGRAARDGRYEFRVGPGGRRDRFAGRFRLRGHVHPVDGPHRDRGTVGQFGARRSGGRTHEGYDILASCGTRLVAARGGRAGDVGYDPRLYGWFVRINARKSGEQYFYAHLISKPEVGEGRRVRTGELVGRVGQTGNAASTPCHLHFELRKRGRLVDPRPATRSWDS